MSSAGVVLTLSLLWPGLAPGQETAGGRGWNPSPISPTTSEDGAGPGVRPAWIDTLDLSGFLALESRTFLEDEAHPGQESGQGTSLALNPELYREWRDGDASWIFEPFLRYDSVDEERTHWDVRQLAYTRAQSRWELTLGISRVFWGVTESQHLVDIVNQTDLVENPDAEDKLGQPMVRLTSVNNWGIVDLFVLTGFRKRSFPGVDGRLRPGLPIDTDRPIYESSAEEWHTDWAVRWSQAVGVFDLGLSYFQGTSREPLLIPDTVAPFVIPKEAAAGADLRARPDDVPSSLLPYYPQITQAGLDAQATLGSWLLKSELMHRTGFEVRGLEGPRPDYSAATYGFEYTFWSALGSSVDVGALVEHLWDERGALATSPFQNDLFTGTRLAFNDTQSSQILVGVTYDLDNQARLWLVEASRRFGSNWLLELEYRGFSGQRPIDPLASLRTDDYLQLSIQRHF
jgi:hypothetical protein